MAGSGRKPRQGGKRKASLLDSNGQPRGLRAKTDASPSAVENASAAQAPPALTLDRIRLLFDDGHLDREGAKCTMTVGSHTLEAVCLLPTDMAQLQVGDKLFTKVCDAAAHVFGPEIGETFKLKHLKTAGKTGVEMFNKLFKLDSKSLHEWMTELFPSASPQSLYPKPTPKRRAKGQSKATPPQTAEVHEASRSPATSDPIAQPRRISEPSQHTASPGNHTSEGGQETPHPQRQRDVVEGGHHGDSPTQQPDHGQPQQPQEQREQHQNHEQQGGFRQQGQQQYHDQAQRQAPLSDPRRVSTTDAVPAMRTSAIGRSFQGRHTQQRQSMSPLTPALNTRSLSSFQSPNTEDSGHVHMQNVQLKAQVRQLEAEVDYLQSRYLECRKELLDTRAALEHLQEQAPYQQEHQSQHVKHSSTSSIPAFQLLS